MRKLVIFLLLGALAALSTPALAATEYNAYAVASSSVYRDAGAQRIARMKAGERVIVQACTASGLWCYVQRVGFDGWVQAAALRSARFGFGSGGSIDSKSGPNVTCTILGGAKACVNR